MSYRCSDLDRNFARFKEVLDLLEMSTVSAKPTLWVAAEAPTRKVKMDGIHPSIGGVKNGFDALEIWC